MRTRELQEAYKRAKDNLMSIAKKAMHLKRQAEEEAPWDENEEAFAKLSDDLEDLRGCIENNKASLECFRGDISVREIYQRVAAEIEREEIDLQELEDFVNNGEDKINAIKVRSVYFALKHFAARCVACILSCLVLLHVGIVACEAERCGESNRLVFQRVFQRHWVCR